MYVTAIILFITGVAVWLHRARAAPWMLYAGVFAQTVIGLWALSILTQLSPYNTWCLPVIGTEPQLVYVTKTETTFGVGGIALLALPILIFAAIPAVLWLQERCGAMYYPRLTRWMIWPMLGGTLIYNLFALLLAQTVTRTRDATDILNMFQLVGLWSGLLVIPALYGLAIWSFIRRSRQNRR
ncbi:MAG: hypothetical protein AB8B82_06910 [Roseovarius sp.]